MNVQTPNHRNNGYTTYARVMPYFEQATLKSSIRQRGFEPLDIDLKILKPGSIIWARSERRNRFGEDVIDTNKQRPYFLWNYQQIDSHHVPVLHAVKISSSTNSGDSKYELNLSETKTLYNGYKPARINFKCINTMPLTSEFFTKQDRNYDVNTNKVRIHNPDHVYSSAEWEGFIRCRLDAMMWGNSIDFHGPRDKNLSGLLAGIQIPVDYSVRLEISKFSSYDYNIPPAPDFLNGAEGKFKKFNFGCVHGFTEGDLTAIALDVFSKKSGKFIRSLNEQNRIRALIQGDPSAALEIGAS